MSARVRPAASSALWVAGPDRCPSLRAARRRRPSDQPHQRLEPELGGLVGVVTTNRPRRRSPGGVSRGDGRFRVLAAHDRSQPGEDLDARIRAVVLVAVDDGVALAAGHGDRDDLFGEPALGLGGGGARWDRTASASCSSRGMRYSRRRFSAVSSMPPATGNCLPPAVDPGRGPARHQGGAPGPERAPQRIAVEVKRRAAHRLGATGQHDLAHAGLHLRGGVEHGLQTGAAPGDRAAGR